MLVLTRKPNEKIVFPAIGATVRVVSVRSNAVRLGIEAPPEVTVLREELQDRPAGRGPAPGGRQGGLSALGGLLRKRLGVLGQGTALLRRQLLDGRTEDAVATVEEIEDELRLLGYRMEAETREMPAVRRGPARKALLVEDNANERELLASLLRASGLDVDTAGDGCDALDYLKAGGRPDVVLLDMGLPRCDGPTAVRAIRRDPALAGLKIFAVTGHQPEEFDLGMGPGGIDRWFHKPLDPAALLHDLTEELAGQPCPA